MDKTVIKFGDNEIQKHKFYQYKKHILVNNIYINYIRTLYRLY